MRIDAHQHFWKYAAAEYGWIDSQRMSVLQRDFLPVDLQVELRATAMDGAISVQARQTLAETEWLLDLAREHDDIRGVVGWVPLVTPEVGEVLERLGTQPKFKGVRHVLHDEDDEQFMLRADFNAGMRALKRYELVYDLLIKERHLPQTIEFVDRHPQQVFVVDHIAKPRIAEDEMEPWAGQLRDLARRENVCCKLSGVVTEADWDAWTAEQLQPYFEVVWAAFGVKRLMFGSDWPVCLLASTYGRWVETVSGFVSPEEQDHLFGETAATVYRLDRL